MTDRTLPEQPGALRTALPFAGALLAVAMGLGYLIHAPYLLIEPGPATNMLAKIKAPGGDLDRSRGELLLTTASVSSGSLSVWETIVTWARRDGSLVPQGAFRPACVTDEEQRINDLAEIERSKLNAELAAFRTLGMRVLKIAGARVLRVFEGGPADGKLRAGDLITAIDGTPTPDHESVSSKLSARKPGDPVEITVLRDGTPRDVSIRTRAAGGCEPNRPVIRIALAPAYRFPRDVEIDTEDVGGPSGGLVFALSVIDAFTPGDLTRGHVVAVTGTIEFAKRAGDELERCDPDPSDTSCVPLVGEVGGIEQKIGSALSRKADVFIVPASEVEQMRRVAPATLRIVGVRTVAQAVQVLRSLSAQR